MPAEIDHQKQWPSKPTEIPGESYGTPSIYGSNSIGGDSAQTPTVTVNPSEDSTESGLDSETASSSLQEPSSDSYSFSSETGTTDGMEETLETQELKPADESEMIDTRDAEEVIQEFSSIAGYSDTISNIVIDEHKETASSIGPWLPILLGTLAGLVLGAVLLRVLQIGLNALCTRIRKVRGVTLQGIGTRENQQDSVYLSDPESYAEEGVLFCVADGMGGLDNGALVSRTAVRVISEKFPYADRSNPEELLASLVQAASYSVNALLSPNYGSGGTTVVIGYLSNRGELSFAAVGDSRICLVRDDSLYRLNRQHCYADELTLAAVNGEMSNSEARRIPKQDALTSYLGMGSIKHLDLSQYRIPVQKGDRLIVMSDGVFNTLTDREIVKALRGPINKITERMARKIEGKHVLYQDNYSAVILAVQ